MNNQHNTAQNPSCTIASTPQTEYIEVHDVTDLLIQQANECLSKAQAAINSTNFALHHATLMTLVRAIKAYCIQQDNTPKPIPLSGYGYKVVCYFYPSLTPVTKRHGFPTNVSVNLGVFATYTSAIEALQPHKANPFYAGCFMSEEGNHA